MKKKITKSLSFCLALVLMLSMFSMAAAAAEHVHNYVVTTDYKYDWISNDQHRITEIHTHLCSCGEKFYETHGEKMKDHEAAPGSQVNKGSYWGDGCTYTVYQYTCRVCNHTYTKTEVSIPQPASTEQAE